MYFFGALINAKCQKNTKAKRGPLLRRRTGPLRKTNNNYRNNTHNNTTTRPLKRWNWNNAISTTALWRIATKRGCTITPYSPADLFVYIWIIRFFSMRPLWRLLIAIYECFFYSDVQFFVCICIRIAAFANGWNFFHKAQKCRVAFGNFSYNVEIGWNERLCFFFYDKFIKYTNFNKQDLY